MSLPRSKVVNMNIENQNINNEIKNTSWASEYNFKSHFHKLNDLNLHYVDEGEGPAIIFLHGNPTWSFYYRNLINGLKDNYRCIAVDNIGCGLSDKPQDYEYTLENHISNAIDLIKSLGLKNFSLVVHDWGGAIGMGVATRMKESVTSMVIMNTAAFKSKDIPFSISICKLPVIGEELVRHFNLFAWPATFMAPAKKLSKAAKEGLLYPYNNYQNRIATAHFVKDIPLTKNHRSYKTLDEIESKLPEITCPKLFLWGAKDFCFNLNFLKRWRDFYPSSKYKILEKAGHYLLEDEKEECLTSIKDFFNEYSAKN